MNFYWITINYRYKFIHICVLGIHCFSTNNFTNVQFLPSVPSPVFLPSPLACFYAWVIFFFFILGIVADRGSCISLYVQSDPFPEQCPPKPSSGKLLSGNQILCSLFPLLLHLLFSQLCFFIPQQWEISFCLALSLSLTQQLANCMALSFLTTK